MATMHRNNAFAAFAAALEQADLPDDIEVTTRVIARVERKTQERIAAAEAARIAERDAAIAEAERQQKAAEKAERAARAAELSACERGFDALAAFLAANNVMPWDLNARFARLFAETDRVAPQLRLGSRTHGLRARMKDVATFVERLSAAYSKHAVRVHLYGKPGDGRDASGSGRPCVDWLMVADRARPEDGEININDPKYVRLFTTLEV